MVSFLLVGVFEPAFLGARVWLVGKVVFSLWRRAFEKVLFFGKKFSAEKSKTDAETAAAAYEHGWNRILYCKQ